MKLRKKADRVFSKWVRSIGVCQFCGERGTEVQLHTAHVISRKCLTLRYSEDNTLCLCAKCHWHFDHYNPLAFADFVKMIKGKLVYENLKEQAKQKRKGSYEFYQDIINRYEKKGCRKIGE
jgi:hypothetical protein